jgi:hypothetical protein
MPSRLMHAADVKIVLQFLRPPAILSAMKLGHLSKRAGSFQPIQGRPRSKVRKSVKYFAIFVLALSSAANAATQRADRTITWRPWQEWAEFQVRTGDRYLGGARWEHYLGFELYKPSSKKIKISMISLAGEPVPDVVIAPGRRYAILKVTNSNMTVHKGRWSWTAQEMSSRNRRSHVGVLE